MRLETARLILRDFEIDDWRATNQYESDPLVAQYQSFDVMTEAQSKDYIIRDIRERAVQPRRVHDKAMILKESGELIGRVGICITKPDLNEGTVWYVMRRDQWGRGLMTEAVKKMIEFGFQELKIRRFIADTDPENIGSIQVLLKNGFRQEAHHRLSLFIKGRWCDSLEFALLRDYPNSGTDIPVRVSEQ